VLRLWDDAHSEALEVARKLTDVELADDTFMKKFEGETYGHYPDHYGDLGAAIKGKDDLLALVQSAWIGFRLAVGAIGLPGLEQRTSTGWSYKDLAAHAAAWEDRTASRLATLRESGAEIYPSVNDTDQFNAAVVERTGGRDAREVLGELDAAHALQERLVGVAAAVDPQRLVFAVVIEAQDERARRIVPRALVDGDAAHTRGPDVEAERCCQPTSIVGRSAAGRGALSRPSDGQSGVPARYACSETTEQTKVIPESSSSSAPEDQALWSPASVVM